MKIEDNAMKKYIQENYVPKKDIIELKTILSIKYKDISYMSINEFIKILNSLLLKNK